MKPKLLVILGPTSSGKSDLAVDLALKFNGEVVSADSRQVYKGMDIGTGKITRKEMMGVPHHLLDVVSPKTRFTVTQYVKKAEKAIEKIHKNKKLPIVCGGTGFYIQALIDGITIPEVKPDWALRKKLEKYTAEELFQQLEKLDSERAKNIDRHNKRRLIRAIEIIIKTKKPISPVKKKQKYNVLIIGIKTEKQELKNKIHTRLLKRLEQGMAKEIKSLNKSGLSWNRLEELGLEYRFVALYLQNKMDYKEMVEKLQKEIEHYAKRQMTWFKKDKRIIWIHPPKFCGTKLERIKKTAEMLTLVKNFIS
ncbi:tRNA (adenosine(37)-N6)-dimethylallyltransferase MiaA [Patescibacteria group bacterium]|nr:tRNA (adenosine(37)-N6)-dimethylallyltransferase MiaA [Patescibacteria group bacterium]